MSTIFRTAVLLLLSFTLAIAAEPKAARSLHWGYESPPCEAFSLSMTIDETAAGSYFMAAGWNTGYFGLQDLGEGRKVVIFSVWDPTKGDDPSRVKDEERVECLYQAENVRIKRFGGEGTGGQCMADFAWKLKEPTYFLVTGKPEGEKTSYGGYVRRADETEWKHLVTFRTRTGGKPLGGLYSFVEDFRRNGKSVKETRSARYGSPWIFTADAWKPIARANFTASNSETEAKDTIDAGLVEGQLFLTTGGETKQTLKINSRLDLPAPPAESKPSLPAKPAQP